jgi:hypothetical protein
MLGKPVAVLLGVGLLLSGTALAAQRTGSAVTITNASVTAQWKESYVKGQVSFAGTKTTAGEVQVSLRNVATGRVMRTLRLTVGAGSFTGSLRLTARPLPGTYRLRVKEFPTGAAADRNVDIPAPSEGVIDMASMSATRSGRRMTVIKNAKKIYAHFHFMARPQTNTLTFKWQKPGNPQVRFTGYAKKPYATDVSTFVCVKSTAGGSCLDRQLRTGKWYCIVYADGKVVKRQDVRVT